MTYPRHKAVTIAEMIIALVVTSILAVVGYVSYTAIVAYTQQQFVNASAEQLSDQLCAAALLNRAPMDGLTREHLDNHIDDILSIDVDHISVHPASAPHMQLKGTQTAQKGYAYVRGASDHYAVFPVNKAACSGEPVIMTGYPQAAGASAATPTQQLTGSDIPLAAITGASGPGQVGAFDRAIHAQSPINISGNFQLTSGGKPAAIYVNGDFACTGNSRIQAHIHATGSAAMSGNCAADGIWANNTVTASGNFRTQGPLTSAQGSVTLNGNADASGNIYAAGTTNAQTREGQDVRQGLPGLPEVPSQPLPVITYAALTDRNTPNWSAIVDAQRANSKKAFNPCSVSSSNWSVGRTLELDADTSVIDATDCPTLTWQGPANRPLISLSSDVTIVVNDFTVANTVTVTSSDGQEHWLRIISPWANVDAVDCGASGGGDITITTGGIATDGFVKTLLYTPGTVNMSGNVDLTGQIYGCAVNASGNTDLTYEPVPSVN